ncbi:KTSC domain-containing protein [Cellulomonas wangsupingiae]|uniref:KTSC domain-containing protein n=1 Tax=Cellulomonas wangsupingiae TaxID=2968085 RepID=A0ABY5K6I4_9CELL|nr:KTSC domain-containing protein [Cellulomonas wangsupingiae]MCC2333759.1 KTSC domain-containing protein [Cellulomonas wangsupingiae]MCM0639421.1 KTSC domain-containing protein [Cellulomonas wangsupingiae]UUI65021.1 KTSC domain-containing protein [Cellulomonas wangsupingiae]
MFRTSSALRPRAARHDAASGTLTVRLTSVSGGSWAEYEYRDVPADVAHRVTTAGVRLRAALLEHVVDRYAVRRCGTPRWVEPATTGPA